MANDLLVSRDTTLTVSDEPSPEIAQYVQRIKIQTFADLASSGLIRESSLDAMLAAGRKVTSEALQRAAVTRPVPLIPATKRLDLGRYTAFQIQTAAIKPTEREIFWKIYRDVDPHKKVDHNFAVKIPDFISVMFKDCIIEPGATLEFTGKSKRLTCNNLIIQRTGRIVARSGLRIVASSIQGEQ